MRNLGPQLSDDRVAYFQKGDTVFLIGFELNFEYSYDMQPTQAAVSRGGPSKFPCNATCSSPRGEKQRPWVARTRTPFPASTKSKKRGPAFHRISFCFLESGSASKDISSPQRVEEECNKSKRDQHASNLKVKTALKEEGKEGL